MHRRHLIAPILALLAVLVVLGGAACERAPDTRLQPRPPMVSYAPLHHPFQGARLFRDTDTAAGRWAVAHGARWLEPIASQPQARWLTSPQDVAALPDALRNARQQRALAVLVAYYVPDRGCDHGREGAPGADAYDRWIGQLVGALAGTRAVIVMEPDAVAADCFDAERAAILRRNVQRLAGAGQYVYLDAGHSRWRSSGEMAQRLIASGIQYAEGFSVNVSNRQTTADSYAWGRELSDLVGDREFVIDTSRNGLGPPPDEPSRDDEWCNPARQALGDRPAVQTGRPGLAATLWIKAPGESDGICGGERTYFFSPNQARTLIVNSPFVSPEYRRLATAAPAAAPAG